MPDDRDNIEHLRKVVSRGGFTIRPTDDDDTIRAIAAEVKNRATRANREEFEQEG